MPQPMHQPKQPIIHWTPAAVAARLHELDLTEELLVEVVRYALTFHAECTANDAPSAPGFLLWDKAIRGLRDRLAPQGWKAVTQQNYPTVVHPDGTFALTVAGGDQLTGDRRGKHPATRNDKGSATQDAVHQNQAVLWPVSPNLTPQAKQTWILLLRVDQAHEEVRAELSLPSGIGDDGRISWWVERIILTASPYGLPSLQSSKDDDDDDGEEIEVVRRTG